MKTRTIVLAGAALLALGASAALTPPAAACEPCATTLDLEKSLEAADLVIMGQIMPPSKRERKAAAEAEAEESEGMARPDTVRVSVLYVFKGTAGKSTITVNAWDGMCDYGITATEGMHLLILSQKETGFDSVNNGCAVKSLPMDDGTVTVEGHQLDFETLRGIIGRIARR